jgi:FkbH-like protein
MYKYACSLDAVPYVTKNLSNIIKSIFGKNKKVLALDLDNTLWGGVVGDDGVEGIEIGEETATSECYKAFQEYVKKQKSIGIMLTVASKNDHENAIAGLNHPEGVLRPDDFIVIKANWETKDRNLVATASEMDLGIDSFVFADDNPTERALVERSIKGIAIPVFDVPADYIRTIDRNGYFEVTNFSADDLKRNDMYKANVKRAELSTEFADYNEYLLSLDMKGEIKPFSPVYMQRITQLTNKSNQFNLTTKRYTQPEIESVASDGKHITLYGKLSDTFGDNGVVSVVIGEIKDNVCDIDLWLMSCRVLKKNMEFAMLDTLVAECKNRNVDTVIGHYYPTAKNGMVKNLFNDFGFEKTFEGEDGTTEWKLSVAGYQNKNKVIKVNTEE